MDCSYNGNLTGSFIISKIVTYNSERLFFIRPNFRYDGDYYKMLIRIIPFFLNRRINIIMDMCLNPS